MKGFKLLLPDGLFIRFNYYRDVAPETVKAFEALLPFTKKFFHARVSGQEIWFDDLQPLHISQENASVFTEPGEVVLGPALPSRVKTANCFGIYYGEGKGLDAANIFAKVHDEDKTLLQKIGDAIWKEGAIELKMESWNKD